MSVYDPTLNRPGTPEPAQSLEHGPDPTLAGESSPRAPEASSAAAGAQPERERPAVRQIRQVVRALLGESRVEEAVEILLSALAAVVDRNAELEKRVRAALQRRSKSEQIDVTQLRLALEELALVVETAQAEIDKEMEADAALDEEIRKAKEAEQAARAGAGSRDKKRPNGRNQALRTEGLPRRITEVPVPEAMRDWVQIGVHVVERLGFSPSHFYIEEIREPVLRAPEAVGPATAEAEAEEAVESANDSRVEGPAVYDAAAEDAGEPSDPATARAPMEGPAGHREHNEVERVSALRSCAEGSAHETAGPSVAGTEPARPVEGASEADAATEGAAAEDESVPVRTRGAERPDEDPRPTRPGTIVTLRAPPTLLAGSMAGISVYAEVTLAKFEEHQPLHRQHCAWLRDQGVYVPVSTIAGWVCHVGEALRRLQTAALDRMRRAPIVQMDGTGIQVLDPGPEHVHRGTIWCYIGRPDSPDDPYDVVFVYTPTGRGETGPWTTLAGREGPIVCDASGTHDRLFNGKVARAIEVGCNAHARRKFVPLLGSGDPRAAYPIQLYRRLYRIETLANVQHLTSAQRTALRQERSRPVVTKLHAYLARLVLSEPPGSDLANACAYAVNHWTALTRFVDDGRLPLDNNRSESQLRRVRLGENNYLFAGSDDAAERMAAILTVLATARAHGLNLRVYLTDVLTRLSSPCSRAHIDAMLPGTWVAPPDG